MLSIIACKYKCSHTEHDHSAVPASTLESRMTTNGDSSVPEAVTIQLVEGDGPAGE